MLKRILASSRYVVSVTIFVAYFAVLSLLLYEAVVVVDTLLETFRSGVISAKTGKTLAVGMIEAIDVVLIAMVVYIICLGLYKLFVDSSLPIPSWLVLNTLDDLKNQLVSVLIAVFAILFLREAVARSSELDLFSLGLSLAAVIAALTFYLGMKGQPKA